MHIIENLNKNFTKCFLKNWNNLTEREEQLLTCRKEFLNTQFEFTDEIIEKIRRINQILQQLEKRVKQHLNTIHQLQLDWRTQVVIDSCDLDVVVQCFNDDYYVQWNDNFDGNPFYHFLSLISIINRVIKDDPFHEANFNEFLLSPGHPLEEDNHCNTFHHLYNNSFLAWEDILRIEEIIVVIVVQNEFNRKV